MVFKFRKLNDLKRGNIEIFFSQLAQNWIQIF